jgi:hypothetical protein
MQISNILLKYLLPEINILEGHDLTNINTAYLFYKVLHKND